MRNINFGIKSNIVRAISGTILATFIFAGASYAQTQTVSVRKTNHNLAHYTEVAGKDTAHVTKRGAVKTADFTKAAAKDTGKAVKKASVVTADAVKIGSEDAAHDTKVAGKKTGKFFRRAGRAIY